MSKAKHFVPATVPEGKLEVDPENVAKFKDWLANRGGLAVWESQDLADPTASWTAPYKDAEGNIKGPPHWKCGGADAKPTRVITDPADVVVVIYRELRRFYISLEQSGHMLNLTSASSAKVRNACQNIPGARYNFDYDTQEAIISAPEIVVPLAEFDHVAWENQRTNHA